MAAKRVLEKLPATKVAKEKKPGMYPDGGGLYLRIAEDGGRSWIFRYVLGGRQRYMGLGAAMDISLAEARERARDARRLKADGIDPIEAKVARRTAAKAETAKAMTFKAVVEAYIKSHRAGWRNAKHGDQWRNTLTTYTYPHFGDLSLPAIDTGLVLKALEPIWTSKTETAGRVRGRIEAVLDWATARDYRAGLNPARWKGHLENLLPKRSKVRKVKHHPALPYTDIGTFMVDLRKQPGDGARALELLILTATRTSDVIAAPWPEFDLGTKVWEIPAERMKAEREHRVPLSASAVAILQALHHARSALPEAERSPWVFPGVKGKHLSNGAILALLKRMKRGDITGHGFRSTFKDWASEQTGFANEVSEMALAHAVEDKTEGAYRRDDLFEKRKRLMDAWAGYCGTVSVKGSNVTTLQKKITA